jgi:hypothetical protein
MKCSTDGGEWSLQPDAVISDFSTVESLGMTASLRFNRSDVGLSSGVDPQTPIVCLCGAFALLTLKRTFFTI